MLCILTTTIDWLLCDFLSCKPHDVEVSISRVWMLTYVIWDVQSQAWRKHVAFHSQLTQKEEALGQQKDMNQGHQGTRSRLSKT